MAPRMPASLLAMEPGLALGVSIDLSGPGLVFA